AIAHGAQPTLSQPLVRGVEVEMLGGPHLVLTNLGGDDDVLAARCLERFGDRAPWHDPRSALLVVEAFARAPFFYLAPPVGAVRALVAAGLDRGHDRLDGPAAVGYDAHFDRHDLVDRRAVDVDVNLLAVRREGIEAASDAIVEPCAKAQDELRLVHGKVR